jgi:hypothetical protein
MTLLLFPALALSLHLIDSKEALNLKVEDSFGLLGVLLYIDSAAYQTEETQRKLQLYEAAEKAAA